MKKESYNELEICFEDLGKQIDQLENITIDNKIYQIQKYFGGDLKILAIICGLNAANSNMPCIWCKWDKRDKFDPDKLYSITSATLGARTFDDAQMNLNKHGYQQVPILKSINFPNYVIDTLHMMLRITDVLMDLFLIDLQTLDGYLKNYLDLNADTFANKFFKDIKLHLKMEIYKIDEKKKIIQIKSLMGPEKEKIFDYIHENNLTQYLKQSPEHEQRNALVNKIWVDFWTIYQQIKNSTVTSASIKNDSVEWVKTFIQVYNEENVTPYIHALVHHFYQFIDLHGDINIFNEQGIEKLNDLTTSQFYRSTNKKNFIKQLINLRNRLEVLG